VATRPSVLVRRSIPAEMAEPTMATPTEALAVAAQPAQMVTGRKVGAKPPVLPVVAAVAVMAAGYRHQGSQPMDHLISAEMAG
jgi:hypothetical protein